MLDFIQTSANPNQFTFAPINEPCDNFDNFATPNTVSYPNGVNYLNSYFRAVYAKIQKVNKNIPMMITDAFMGASYWAPYYTKGMNIVFDSHFCESACRVERSKNGVTDVDRLFRGCRCIQRVCASDHLRPSFFWRYCRFPRLRGRVVRLLHNITVERLMLTARWKASTITRSATVNRYTSRRFSHIRSTSLVLPSGTASSMSTKRLTVKEAR